jgi:hypothetical protein
MEVLGNLADILKRSYFLLMIEGINFMRLSFKRIGDDLDNRSKRMLRA